MRWAAVKPRYREERMNAQTGTLSAAQRRPTGIKTSGYFSLDGKSSGRCRPLTSYLLPLLVMVAIVFVLLTWRCTDLHRLRNPFESMNPALEL